MSRLRGARLDRHRGAIRRAAAKLARLPGVSHVTLGEKIVNGSGNGAKALKVYVFAKHAVAGAQAIPRSVRLRGTGDLGDVVLATDVIEVAGQARHFSLRGGNLVKARDNEQGIATIGLHKGARGYCLTNAHVAIDFLAAHQTPGLSYLEPADGSWRDIGPVILTSDIPPGRIIREDWAVVEAASPAAMTHFGLFTNPTVAVARTDILRQGLGEHWFIVNGVIHRCDGLEPLQTPANVEVEGEMFAYLGVWQANMTQGQSHPGMSGALLCRTTPSGIVACGQVFGGIEDALVWAFPFGEMFKRVWAQLPD